MTEYLIGPGSPVKTLTRLSGKGFKASENALTGGDGAADDQDRIVAPNGAKHIGPSLAIEGSSDGLGTSGNRAEHEHLAHTVDPEEELRQKSIERCSAFLYAAVGNSISGAFGSRNPGKPQFPQVTRECCLGHIPAALEQKLAEILLAAHDSRVYNLEDRVVSFALIGHGTEFSTAERIARAGMPDH
jgi:hypothetical protein